MKKVIIALIALVALSSASFAQTSDALGVRLGYGTAFGGEISYQKGLGDINRLEADLGVTAGHNWFGASLSGIYQWHWFVTDGLGFYIGPGAQVNFVNQFFGVEIGGQIGLDYEFDAPIQISLDWRPMWNFVGSSFFDYGAALGIRYIF